MAARKDRPRGAAPAPTDGAAAVAAAPAAADEAGAGVWRYIRPTTLAKLAVWAVLQVIFYRLEFGLVFFIASCFYWVWDSMSSSSASTVDGERVSAYSVFNRGVNALPGTLNANEFDNMMRGGFAPPPGGEEEKRPAVGRVDDNDDDEDQAVQRAAMASLKHRKAATEQQKMKSKKPPPTTTTTKARTYASSSSSSSVAAPKPLVFDSDLQALMRSVAKP